MAIARIDSLWTGKRQYKRGSLLGAVGGAILEIAAGETIQSLCEEGSSINCCSSAIPILGTAGAANGAFYGSIIGAVFNRWELRAPPR